ncbi:MAG: hypothetical protein IPM54_17235 [Polyangiaceae bacterium]|nr:hypothetical protein [Polyangiaceae bacterium]
MRRLHRMFVELPDDIVRRAHLGKVALVIGTYSCYPQQSVRLTSGPWTIRILTDKP